jgi:hypothetical protein
METLRPRAWKWDAGMEVTLKEDPKRHTLTIEAKPAHKC